MSYQDSPANSAPTEVLEFIQLLQSSLPAARVAPDAGGVKAGNWWLECSHSKSHVTVEWRPRQGFGVTDPSVESEYGEGPAEIYRDVRLAVRRVEQCLRLNGGKRNRSSWLRQLREVQGISQVELARRLKINQAAVSRMENREDWKVATLVAAVEAMGGRMEVTLHFKDCDISVRLPDTSLKELETETADEWRTEEVECEPA